VFLHQLTKAGNETGSLEAFLDYSYLHLDPSDTCLVLLSQNPRSIDTPTTLSPKLFSKKLSQAELTAFVAGEVGARSSKVSGCYSFHFGVTNLNGHLQLRGRKDMIIIRCEAVTAELLPRDSGDTLVIMRRK
jgi:hypothetical protein